jgi:hypothetical protein
MDEEVNTIFHVRTTEEILNYLYCMNIVGNNYLSIIIAQKCCGEHIHFFYNHLKSISKNGGRRIKLNNVCIARKENS